MVSVKEEIDEFARNIGNNGFERDKLKDMLTDLDVERAGVQQEMNKILDGNEKGTLDKSVNWQREWAILQSKIFIIEQKKEILLASEYAQRQLDKINSELQ